MAALHEAVLSGNLECVKLLVKYGADINQKDEDGWTPLHIACSDGHADIARSETPDYVYFFSFCPAVPPWWQAEIADYVAQSIGEGKSDSCTMSDRLRVWKGACWFRTWADNCFTGSTSTQAPAVRTVHYIVTLSEQRICLTIKSVLEGGWIWI